MHKIIPSFFYANNALILTLCLLMPMTSMGTEQAGRALGATPTHKLIIAANTLDKQANQPPNRKPNTAKILLPQNGQGKDIHNKWFGIRLNGDYRQRQTYLIITIATITSMLLALLIGLIFQLRRIRQIQHTLLESENKYRTLVDNLPQSVFFKDKNHVYISCNKNYADELGITPEQIVGKDDYTFHPEHADVYRNDDLRVMHEQCTIQLEEEYIKNGQTLIVQTTKTPVYDEKGKLWGVLGIFWDITQRKHAESELLNTHQSLKQIQYAMDQVGIGIHIVDIHGLFRYVNEAASTMLGYRPQEMLGMGIPDIDPNFPADKFEEISAPLRIAQPGRLETTQTTKDGQTIPVEVIFHFIPGETETDGHFISFLVNLTERKQAEKEKDRLQQQLLQARKMETIGQLTGGIAHDFNNILGAMLGYTELLQDGLNKQYVQKDKCIDYLNQILKSGNRAREVIAKMLLFSRKPPIQFESVIPIIKLQPVMNEVIAFLHASLPASIKLSSQFNDENITARIQGVQLHQILLNLGINARDAIDIYGHITFRQSRRSMGGTCVSCHTKFSGDYVELTVMDNGKGISADLINNIFDPFYSTKDFGQGTGMGLSIVHGIVHAANGHIIISDQEQAGTCVSILLPCVTEKETDLAINQASIPEHTTPNLLQGIKLMVVDDEPALVALLDTLLSTHGAVVTGYIDPTDALAEFDKNPTNIDLVITDMTMPGISGLDMSRKMLRQRPELPIILCTGYSDQVNESIASQNGIARFMLKPVSIPDLIDTIHQLVTVPCDVS